MMVWGDKMYKLKVYNKETREMMEVVVREDCDRLNAENVIDFLKEKKMSKQVIKDMMYQFDKDEESCIWYAEMFFSGELIDRISLGLENDGMG